MITNIPTRLISTILLVQATIFLLSACSSEDNSSKPLVDSDTDSVADPTVTPDPVILLSFDFVEYRGRPGHKGLFPVQGQPIAGSAIAMAKINSDAKKPTFQLRSLNKNDIGAIEMSAASPFVPPDIPPEALEALSIGGERLENILYGNIDLPDEPFHIIMITYDSSGNPIEFTYPNLFIPQLVEAKFSSKGYFIPPYETVTVELTVTNHSLIDEFDVVITGSNVTIHDVSPSVLTIEESQTKNVIVTFSPTTSQNHAELGLSATVVSTSNPNRNNYANRIFRVGSY